MAVQRAAARASLIDVLDRVLDKGIVIDAWVRVALVGIDLITIKARVVVASIETYLKYSDELALAASGPTSAVGVPQLDLPDDVPRIAAAGRNRSRVRRE
jgi:hypothetical protein